MLDYHSRCVRTLACICLTLAAAWLPSQATAQILSYPDPCLDFVYPAGGQRGQTVEVQLGGPNGLTGATGVIIDGPPGVTVSEFKSINYGEARAKFTIAADAAPGRRLVRVLGGANGLTNFRCFFVGPLPEVLETEPNNSPDVAQEIAPGVVVNGKLDPLLDVDCFRIQAETGQQIFAAVLAHGMDMKQRLLYTPGFVDSNLELLDAQGNVVAAAEDSLGLDPILQYAAKTAGPYTLRIRAVGYKGSPTAVYRVTLGDLPYPTSVFPPGGKRGETVDVEFSGPQVAAGTRQTVSVAADPFPVDYLTLAGPQGGAVEVPFVRGDYPELIEQEPNDEAAAARLLQPPQTANGQFQSSTDEDWYRLTLKQGQGAVFHTMAQRHLRSPVDTLIEVYDAAGKKLAENDDGALFGGQCAHDFASADSWLPFTAPADGDYLLRVRDQTGAAGPQAVYRLTVEPLQADFLLYQWPDAVPIWGPGATASFVVQVMHWGGMKSDIQLRIEGLPEGWTASGSIIPVSYYGIMPPPYGMQVLMTITAPADAAPGALAPFRVLGVAEQDGRRIEHETQSLTLFGSSHNDRMFLRYSHAARAVVAPPLDCRLETSVRELTVARGGSVEIPVKVYRADDKAQIGVSIDGPTVAAGTGWRAPLTLAPDQNELMIPLQPSTDWPPGVYPLVVSRSWAADIRAGRPGPCTQIIYLRITP